MKRFTVNPFSISSIRELQKGLEEYKKTIVANCEEAVKRLAECGIETAKLNTGKYGKYIVFSMKVNSDDYGCEAIITATNTGMIKSEWRTADGVKTADVNPLLMAEFGSGLRAENPFDVKGVGTGTFPSETAKDHATDPNGWWYMDTEGEWHHSYGMKPSAPMYNAWLEMYSNIETVMKEVFRENG